MADVGSDGIFGRIFATHINYYFRPSLLLNRTTAVHRFTITVNIHPNPPGVVAFFEEDSCRMTVYTIIAVVVVYA